MKFRPLAVTAAVAALLLAGAGVALAQDATTGPDTVACTDATAAAKDYTGITDAQSALDKSGLAAQVKSFTDGFANQPSLAVLQAAVQASVDADNVAGEKVDSDKTVAAKAAVKVRVDLIASVQVKLDAANKAVADAITEKARLDKAATGACTAPAPVTTTPAAPTTTPAPAPGPLYATCAEASAAGVYDIPAGAPGYRPELDSDGDQVACERPTALENTQVTLVPNAVNTGRA